MKIPAGSRQIGLRNKVQQLRRYGIDRDLIVRERNMRNRIYQLRGERREITVALGQRRHCGENVVRIAASAPSVIAKKKRLGAAVINVRNVERAADGNAKTVLVVIGFGFGLSIERKRFGIQGRTAVAIEHGAVRLVHVE